MKARLLQAMNGAAFVLLAIAAARGEAQQRAGGGLQVTPIDRYSGMPIGGMQGPRGMHRFGFGGGLFVIERDYVPVVVEREVVREEAPAPPPPPPARKPWVLGRLYAALPPHGCMKMIQGGASYFQCSGEWYRQVPGGYRAVARP